MKQYLDEKQVQILLDMKIDNPICAHHKQIDGYEESHYDNLSICELIERIEEVCDIHIKSNAGIDIFDYDEGYVVTYHTNSELIDNLFDCYIQLIKNGIINI